MNKRKDYFPSGIRVKKKTTTKEGKRLYQKLYMKKRRRSQLPQQDFNLLYDIFMKDYHAQTFSKFEPEKRRGC